MKKQLRPSKAKFTMLLNMANLLVLAGAIPVLNYSLNDSKLQLQPFTHVNSLTPNDVHNLVTNSPPYDGVDSHDTNTPYIELGSAIVKNRHLSGRHESQKTTNSSLSSDPSPPHDFQRKSLSDVNTVVNAIGLGKFADTVGEKVANEDLTEKNISETVGLALITSLSVYSFYSFLKINWYRRTSIIFRIHGVWGQLFFLAATILFAIGTWRVYEGNKHKSIWTIMIAAGFCICIFALIEFFLKERKAREAQDNESNEDFNRGQRDAIKAGFTWFVGLVGIGSKKDDSKSETPASTSTGILVQKPSANGHPQGQQDTGSPDQNFPAHMVTDEV